MPRSAPRALAAATASAALLGAVLLAASPAAAAPAPPVPVPGGEGIVAIASLDGDDYAINWTGELFRLEGGALMPVTTVPDYWEELVPFLGTLLVTVDSALLRTLAAVDPLVPSVVVPDPDLWDVNEIMAGSTHALVSAEWDGVTTDNVLWWYDGVGYSLLDNGGAQPDGWVERGGFVEYEGLLHFNAHPADDSAPTSWYRADPATGLIEPVPGFPANSAAAEPVVIGGEVILIVEEFDDEEDYVGASLMRYDGTSFVDAGWSLEEAWGWVVQGDRIAFAGYDGDDDHVYVLDPVTGTPVPTGIQGYPIGFIGEDLIVYSRQDGDPVVMRYDGATATPIPGIAAFDGLRCFVEVEDGGYLCAYDEETETERLWFLGVDGGGSSGGLPPTGSGAPAAGLGAAALLAGGVLLGAAVAARRLRGGATRRA